MNLSSSFFQKLKNGCKAVSMNPEHLLNVMALESGISASSHNKNGNASGLLQFMPSTLKGLGYKGTHQDFRELKAEEQLDYCFSLIRGNMRINGGPFVSASQYYVGNFLPIALTLPGIRKNDPSTVIVAKNPDVPHLPKVSAKQETIYFNANTGLDVDKDGQITLGDIEKVLARARGSSTYKEAVAALHQETMNEPSEKKETYYWDAPGAHNDVEQVSHNDSAVENIIEKELSLLVAYEALPKNQFLICIGHADLDVSLEYARVLCQALETELISTASIHHDDKHVEVYCELNAPEQIAFEATNELVYAVKDVFAESVQSFAKAPEVIFLKGKPKQPLISTATIVESYRTFHLKAMQ